MGYDKSKPRNKIIFAVFVGSALSLAAFVPLLENYFGDYYDIEMHAKVYDVETTTQAGIAEKQELVDGSSLTLSAAMDQIASGNRRGTAVAPQAIDDFDSGEASAIGTLCYVRGWIGHEHTEDERAAANAIREARAVEQARRDAIAAAAAAAAEAAAEAGLLTEVIN